MSNTNSSLRKADWEPWIQSWRFSNHAVFRIPEYLDSMMRDWCQRSPLLSNKAFQPEPFYYFRHPLTKETNSPANYTPLIQFAQSAILTSLLNSAEDEVKAVVEAKDGLQKFKTYLKGKSVIWNDFLIAFKTHHPDFNYLEEEISFSDLETLSDGATDIDNAVVPKLFHHLFLAFCSVSHRGYLQQRLNECHLPLSAKARDKIVGYFLDLAAEDDPEKLPPIQRIRALQWDGSLNTLHLGDSSQPEPYDILGLPKDEAKRFDDYLLEMFEAVNGGSSLRPRKPQYLVAVPVYEWSAPPNPTSEESQTEMRHRGGALLGWVLNRLPKNVNLAKVGWARLDHVSETIPQRHRLYRHLCSLSFLTETFAFKYMSGDTEWALERKWKNEDNAQSYMESNFHHSCSWVCGFPGVAKEETQKGKGITETDLNQAKEDYFHRVEDGRLLVNLSKDASSHDARESSDPLIASLTPTIHYLEPDPSVSSEHFTSIAEHARYFYRDRAHKTEIQRELLRKIGEFSGQSKTFHDYSKDLNVLDDQLSRYAEEAVEVRDKIETEVNELLTSGALPPESVATLQRVREHAQKLGVPKFDYILRLRFLMSHLRVKTEGRLYEAPEWCWKLLESGTKRDLYLIIRALVWLPSGWKHFDAQAKVLPDSNRLDEEFTWGRLFLFDEDDEEAANAPAMKGMIDEVFRKLFGRWEIKQSDFAACFPPPKLNSEADWSDRLLWHHNAESRQKETRWLPPARLLPLFVFALRTAFEHAYLRTLLRARDAGRLADLPRNVPRHVRLTDVPCGQELSNSGILHRIHLDFPCAGIESDRFDPMSGVEVPAELPYGNWSKHMNQYDNVSTPWIWRCCRVSGKLETSDEDAWFYRIVLEARR